MRLHLLTYGLKVYKAAYKVYKAAYKVYKAAYKVTKFQNFSFTCLNLNAIRLITVQERKKIKQKI